jgi:hypothetical protein
MRVGGVQAAFFFLQRRPRLDITGKTPIEDDGTAAAERQVLQGPDISTQDK